MFYIYDLEKRLKMSKIRDQIKKRRKELGLRQTDMMLQVGMSRQQYQRLEAQGATRAWTLLNWLPRGSGWKCCLSRRKKLRAVRDILEGRTDAGSGIESIPAPPQYGIPPPYDPWGRIAGGIIVSDTEEVRVLKTHPARRKGRISDGPQGRSKHPYVRTRVHRQQFAADIHPDNPSGFPQRKEGARKALDKKTTTASGALKPAA